MPVTPAIRCGLTADDVPIEATKDAKLPFCIDHPEARSLSGFGYDGGGFGAYRMCKECGAVFGKRG